MSKLSDIQGICYEVFDDNMEAVDAGNVTAQAVRIVAVNDVLSAYKYLPQEQAMNLVNGFYDMWLKDRAVRQ